MYNMPANLLQGKNARIFKEDIEKEKTDETL